MLSEQNDPVRGQKVMTEVCDLSLWLSFMVQLCDFNITVNSNDSLFDLALWFSSTVMFNHVITPIYSI